MMVASVVGELAEPQAQRPPFWSLSLSKRLNRKMQSLNLRCTELAEVSKRLIKFKNNKRGYWAVARLRSYPMNLMRIMPPKGSDVSDCRNRQPLALIFKTLCEVFYLRQRRLPR